MITPNEILAQRHRSSSWVGWVPTYSGKGYRPWDENPGPLSLQDLAYGLSRTLRYGGHSKPGVTVAEHCILAAAIVRSLWPGNEHLERAALLHDASESILHDLQSPIRSSVRVVMPSGDMITWNESDALVTRNIAKFFDVPKEHLEAPEVKAADLLAVCFEKRDCPNLGDGDWGLPEIPQGLHLHIWGWSMHAAMLKYLRAAKHLDLV